MEFEYTSTTTFDDSTNKYLHKITGMEVFLESLLDDDQGISKEKRLDIENHLIQLAEDKEEILIQVNSEVNHYLNNARKFIDIGFWLYVGMISAILIYNELYEAIPNKYGIVIVICVVIFFYLVLKVSKNVADAKSLVE